MKKISQCRKKTERGLGILRDFSTSILSQIIKQLKGGPFGGKIVFRKKSRTMPKKFERRDPLVSPGNVCYAEKKEKPFWFSSWANR